MKHNQSLQNESLIDFKFLQVTINSNKLIQLLQQILKQLNVHQIQILRFQEVVPTLKQSVSQAIDTSQNRMKLQIQTLKNKVSESFQEVNSKKHILEDKITNRQIQVGTQLKVIQSQIQQLSYLQNQSESAFKQNQNYQIANNNNMQSQISHYKDRITNMESQMSEIDEKFNDQFELLFLKVQSMMCNSQNPIQNNKIQFNPNIQFKRTDTSRFGKENKKDNRRVTPKTAVNWARFSVKASQFEKSIQNHCLRNDRFAETQKYPSKNRFMDNNRLMDEKIETQNEINIEQFQQVKNLIYVLDKNKKQTAQQLSQIKNKLVILEQKSLIQLRKIEKDQFQLGQLTRSLKKFGQKKSDEQAVDILSNQMKKSFDQILDDVDKKLYKQTYERQKIKIIQKIRMIQQNIAQKADKGQIKKALLFMQQKIKQLILLIANQQNDQKDGAIRKIPIKCLSCDKGLEMQSQGPSMPSSPIKQPRSTTRNIRKRVQMLSSRLN